MALVESLILVGMYTTALMGCVFFFRLIYIIVTTIWRKINVHRDSAEDSSSEEGWHHTGTRSQEDGDGNKDSNCYDEEQGVIGEGGDDAGSSGGDRCCICLEQMPEPDAAGVGMCRRLRVTLLLKQTTQEAGKTCRRLQGCGHVFHAGCIDEWLKRSRTCPSCRSLVDPTPAQFSARALLLTDDPDVLVRIIMLCVLLNSGLGYCVN
jgi:hypothetical protein